MALNPIDLTRGPARAQLAQAEAVRLRERGVLVADARRERPRWFDGRFLAARDLIRDQQYFLAREADLGRAAGSGVGLGLHVSAQDNGSRLSLGAGQGITPGGELVLLPQDLALDLTDIPATEQLSARFGLGRVPATPARARTGLFVLALRPVEFTANPVGAYPTSLTGSRTVEDGDVVEATAVVLIPWPDDGANDALLQRRASAARAIFVADAARSLASDVLPLAMLALQGNQLVWLDEAMVRRELGADRADLPGLNFSPRALRLAHLLQHQEHLADVVAQLGNRRFSAASQFQALPSAGPLPAGVIDTRDWTQSYFPAEVDVDFAVIPEDELPALIEECLALPPIDFFASEAALDLTAVMVLAPVPRAQLRAVLARLQTRTRTLKAAAANRVAQRKPLEILQRLRLPAALVLPTDPSSPADAEWARLAGLSNLWFVRRRNLAYRDDLAGTAVPVSAPDPGPQGLQRLRELGLGSALDAVLKKATPHAAPKVLDLLSAPRLAASPALTAAALGALQAQATAEGGLNAAAVLGLSAEMSAGRTGTGLQRLELQRPKGLSKAALATLTANDAWRSLDASAAAADAGGLQQLAARLMPQAKPAAAAPTPVAKAGATPKPAAKAGKAPASNAPASPATSSKRAAQARKAKAAKPNL